MILPFDPLERSCSIEDLEMKMYYLKSDLGHILNFEEKCKHVVWDDIASLDDQTAEKLPHMSDAALKELISFYWERDKEVIKDQVDNIDVAKIIFYEVWESELKETIEARDE
ncbi:MAG: hypothetical protein A4E48_00243 [Methanosaeta sp. PtaU1.Bin060]|nr:MAG: hypothetical protein A4E48_00243 [Methanosaeta sp. PtaU1.Bin060]